MKQNRIGQVLAVTALAALAHLPASAEVRYNVKEIGTLGGRYSRAEAINDIGQVVGTGWLYGDLHSHAFLWTPGGLGLSLLDTMADLGTTGGSNSAAYGINNYGRVVGNSQRYDGNYRDFLWVPGSGMQYATGQPDSIARGITDSGWVAGSWTDAYGLQSAFRWSGGVRQDFKIHAEANAISARLDVVGTYYGSGYTRAYYDGYGAASLPTPSGSNSYAYGVNDFGLVAGSVHTNEGASTFRRAVVWNNGSLIYLAASDSNSRSQAVNNDGQAVGSAHHGSVQYAFVWKDKNGNGASDPGEMEDLNALLPAGSHWQLMEATGINEAGQIVGMGVHNGNLRGFVLTPVNAANMTSRIAVSRGPVSYSTVTHRYKQTLTLTHVGYRPLRGAISVVLDSLSSNAGLYNKKGTTASVAPLGSPYLNAGLGGTLRAPKTILWPGETASVTLEFTNSTGGPINYSVRILAGAGKR